MTTPRMVATMRGGRGGVNSLHTSELEKPCDGCAGEGRLDAGPYQIGQECPLCMGSGYVLTETGHELLNFVRRNWWR